MTKFGGVAKRQNVAMSLRIAPTSNKLHCRDNSNHTGAGRTLPPIWALLSSQSAQENVRCRRPYSYLFSYC